MATLTLNEIRIRAAAFTKEFADLWVEKCPPAELAKLKLVKKRVDAVRVMRLASTKEPTRKIALTPTLFGENRQISAEYLLIPRVSSERRQYVPIGYL